MSESKSEAERRRGMRFDCELMICLVGVDSGFKRRRGDISQSGVFFESSKGEGGTGSVQRIEIETLDRVHRVTTLACLVRAVTVDDFWLGSKVRGVAYEFLIDDEATSKAVDQLVRHVADQTPDADGRAAPGGHLADEDLASAVEKALRHSTVVLETGWPVEEGAVVRLCVDSASGDTQRLQGVVEHSLRAGDPPLYRSEIAVHHHGPSRRPASDIHDALGVLLDESIAPAVNRPRVYGGPLLGGNISHVPLTSLFALCEWEHLTGVLIMRREDVEATIFLRSGAPVDVESEQLEGDQRELLKQLLRWRDGEFELHFEAVEREGQLGGEARALVLDLLKEIDEEDRPD
jgi:hypothetical protein